MESIKELYKIGYGPSSSHAMGPARASEYFIRLFPTADHYDVILFGSLALTGRGHLTDKKIIESFPAGKARVIFSTKFDDLPHPNTMEFIAYDKEEHILGHRRIFSIGGGSIRVENEPISAKKEVYPFADFRAIKKEALDRKITLPQIVYSYDDHDIKEYLQKVWQTMKHTIDVGLKTEGVLPGNLHISRKARMLSNPIQNETAMEKSKREIMSYAYAAAEENASGGIVVTAPTCGSSGVLPTVLFYLQKSNSYNDDQIIDALAVASLVGNTIKQNASISGAECGCQAEIGTATAMASAAIAFLFGFNPDQIECAAEVSLEHLLGLTCDPVGGYVQIPCIERNAVCALHAFDSVTIAKYLAESRLVSLDIVIKTMLETGKDITEQYRETAQGGLAKTLGQR